MNRRAFIVGCAIALAATVAGEAQQARVVRIGYLSLVSAVADAANVEGFGRVCATTATSTARTPSSKRGTPMALLNGFFRSRRSSPSSRWT